mmetsp:Transcript_19921/g.49461  ORF Transcript_19921/g.49461 Transcript_19921/m.49461 type:complete len:291 (-) Transcript_19921:530-1402(-)
MRERGHREKLGFQQLGPAPERRRRLPGHTEGRRSRHTRNLLPPARNVPEEPQGHEGLFGREDPHRRRRREGRYFHQRRWQEGSRQGQQRGHPCRGLYCQPAASHALRCGSGGSSGGAGYSCHQGSPGSRSEPPRSSVRHAVLPLSEPLRGQEEEPHLLHRIDRKERVKSSELLLQRQRSAHFAHVRSRRVHQDRSVPGELRRPAPVHSFLLGAGSLLVPGRLCSRRQDVLDQQVQQTRGRDAPDGSDPPQVERSRAAPLHRCQGQAPDRHKLAHRRGRCQVIGRGHQDDP